VGALVGRAHDPPAAARDDHVPVGVHVLGDEASETAGFGVVAAVGHGRAGPGQFALHDEVVGVALQAVEHLLQADAGLLGVHEARAAEDDDGRLDLVLLQGQLGLEQFELQPDGPDLLPQQEILILESQAVGRRRTLGRAHVPLGGLGVLVGGREDAEAPDSLVDHEFSLTSGPAPRI
jgi:hypothetical protein